MSPETCHISTWNTARTPLWKKGKPLLGRLDIELTERCNHNCIHCYINQPEHDAEALINELSFPEIKTILIEAAQLGCLKVRFTGGEPLLRDDFEELYLTARKLGLTVLIFTNAALITPQLVNLWQRIPPLEKIEISMYGLSEKSYRAITRKPHSHHQVKAGIELLLEKKVPFVLKSALLPPNYHELAGIESFAASIPWMEAKPTQTLILDHRCRRDSEEKNKQISQMRLSPQKMLSFLGRNQKDYIARTKAFCSVFSGPPGDLLFSCGAGIGRLSVDAYGSAYPCLTLKHPALGYDLKKGNLEQVLTEFMPEVRKMKANNPDYLRRCASCFLKSLCFQCPAKSWMEHGTLDTPVDYLCEVTHAQARKLGLIRDDEKTWEVVKNWRERINRIQPQKD